MPRVQGNQAEISELLKHLRNRQGLTIKEMANAAGLSEDLVKKYESGRIPITVKSLSRFEKILGPIKKDDEDIQLDIKWMLAELESHNSSELQEQLRFECNKDGGVLPYLYLPLTPSSMQCYLADFRQRDYKSVLTCQRTILNRIASVITAHCQDRKIHIICFTCGHDWIDFDLAQAVAQQTDKQVYVTIIHPSYSLLSAGIEKVRVIIEKIPNLYIRAYVSNYETARSIFTSKPEQHRWRRVVCIFGTLGAYDFDLHLLEFIKKNLSHDDILLFDTINSFNYENDERKVQRIDPRLNGNLPNWALLTDQKIKQVLQEQLQRPIDIQVSSNFAAKRRFPFALGEYAVELTATIDDGILKPWQVSGMRIYRHFVPRVVKKMADMGWRVVHQEDSGPPYPTSLLLFSL